VTKIEVRQALIHNSFRTTLFEIIYNTKMINPMKNSVPQPPYI